MLAFYFILIGMYLFYTRSKYFPSYLFRPGFDAAKYLGILFLILGAGIFTRTYDWASGLLLSFVSASLALCLTQFFATSGPRYFFTVTAIVHILLVIDLISYAR